MSDYPIQEIFQRSFAAYEESCTFLSIEQQKAAYAVSCCKTPSLGYSVSQCEDCGFRQIHYHSCRNRHCPNCQAVNKERWVDARRAEVVDAPYFHVVFTLPHELNPLLYRNQRLLYSLLHRCCAETLLELSADRKYLGAVPGIIQVLHTWNQEMNYHVHMHCIISGGGITRDRRFVTSSPHFFIPVKVLRDKFKGKFLAELDALYRSSSLSFPSSCAGLENPQEWAPFKNSLYQKDWCPYIKETFNGSGNAIEYLGRYTNKIVISNSRILSVSDDKVSFSARGKKKGDPKRTVTLSHHEFIRRFLLHILPDGFQKIRYYGFLNNRMKSKNLKLIFRLQGHRRFISMYSGMPARELINTVWNVDICRCPACGGLHFRTIGHIFARDR